MKFDDSLEDEMKKSTVFPRILLFVFVLVLLAACSTKLTPGQEVQLTEEAQQKETTDGDADPASVPPTIAPAIPEATAVPEQPVAPEAEPTTPPAEEPPSTEGDTPTAVPPSTDDAGGGDADNTSDLDTGGGTGEKTYAVKHNDNLFRIGLNNGCSTAEMSAANNISAPYTIYIGQTIIIPDCK